MQPTGGEIIADYLIAQGVPYLVGIPGHGCLGFLDAFKDRSDRISILQVRHEQSAVHLADAYYRVSGRPLAVFTSIGPGAINTAIGLATAYVDSTAVLTFIGDVHTHMFGRGVLQEIERGHWANNSRLFEPIVKRYWQVTDTGQLPFVLQRAFNEMLHGRPGPALISLPMDVQSASGEANSSMLVQNEPQGPVRPDPVAVERAARLLLAAQRPVILSGGGVIRAGASAEVVALGEFLGAALTTTFQAKGAVPEDHLLAGWVGGTKGTRCGNYLHRTADVILAVGCRFADQTSSSYRRGVTFGVPPTRLIQVDIEAREIGKNYPVEVGIVGDAKAVARDLLEAVRALGKPKDLQASPYVEEIQRQRQAWLEALAPLQNSDAVPVTISRILKELREFLARDAIVVTGAGNAQAQVLNEFPFFVPGTNVTSGGFSTMGFTLPAALGAKLAAPERQVVALCGDGDFMMTMQELATAAQYQIPIVVIIANNYGWQSIRDLQMAQLGSDRALATEFVGTDGQPYSPDFAQTARAFGIHAQRIERPEEVRPALEAAFAAGGPSVIEAIANRDPAAAGITTGWWDVPVPTYLTERRARYEQERDEEDLR